MGQMASALAHELNQPLSANMNYIKAAARTIEGADNDKAQVAIELLDKAAAQTARAGQIIRRLRDFIENGQSIHAVEDINAVVEEALELALVGAAEANVKVKRIYQGALKSVSIDKVQIQQVVLNLVRNAIEAMTGCTRSELTISTYASDATSVTVTILDSGPGLDADVAARLFQPFTTTKETGMGIGLSVCQSIISAHKGQIWATSGNGNGTEFSFTLPTREGG
jgi:two-component system sensor kinase FixL